VIKNLLIPSSSIIVLLLSGCTSIHSPYSDNTNIFSPSSINGSKYQPELEKVDILSILTSGTESANTEKDAIEYSKKVNKILIDEKYNDTDFKSNSKAK
jgi:hypothetical protein